MNNFKRFLAYVKPYRLQAISAIFLNVFYAIFTTLSFVVLMPMLNVLFSETKPITNKPLYLSLIHI